jgi:ABC-type transport system involved in multi-copper enzyme maturation permease subunit
MSGGDAAGLFFGLVNDFGWMISITLGAILWRQDERDGTLFTFMAKPISRIQMLYGKLLGCIYALIIYLGITTLLFALLDLLLVHAALPATMPLFLLECLLEWTAYLSLSLFFSCYFNSLTAAFLVILGGIFSFLARQLIRIDSDTARLVGKIIRFPFIDTNMEFTAGDLFVPELQALKPLLTSAGYFALWSVVLLTASVLIFRTREFYGKRS